MCVCVSDFVVYVCIGLNWIPFIVIAQSTSTEATKCVCVCVCVCVVLWCVCLHVCVNVCLCARSSAQQAVAIHYTFSLSAVWTEVFFVPF